MTAKPNWWTRDQCFIWCCLAPFSEVTDGTNQSLYKLYIIISPMRTNYPDLTILRHIKYAVGIKILSFVNGCQRSYHLQPKLLCLHITRKKNWHKHSLPCHFRITKKKKKAKKYQKRVSKFKYNNFLHVEYYSREMRFINILWYFFFFFWLWFNHFIT